MCFDLGENFGRIIDDSFLGSRSILLGEMLAAYVLLLGGLTHEPDSFNQEMFDQLMNLVVIFCKIIKQRPKMFEEIEETLNVVMQAFDSAENEAFCV